MHHHPDKSGGCKGERMSVLPKIYAARPGGLRELVARWLERFDDHLVSEEPDDAPGSVVS